MDFINFKFVILFIFCLSEVLCTTEEEMAPILEKFKEKLFKEWEKNYLKSIRDTLSDIPDLVAAVQGT